MLDIHTQLVDPTFPTIHRADAVPPHLSLCSLEGLDFKALNMRTLLVDPPRAGLDPETTTLLRNFDSVVYISCNPG